jgi:hypothetical protein
LRCLAVERGPDQVRSLRRAGKNIGVPEAKQLETLGFEVSVADGIACALSVLGSVGLNDEFFRQTNEIHYVITNRKLTTELVLNKPTVPQQGPKPLLGLGRVATHLLGIATQKWRFCSSPLGPCPPCLRKPLIRPSGTFSLKGRSGSRALGYIGGKRGFPLSP